MFSADTRFVAQRIARAFATLAIGSLAFFQFTMTAEAQDTDTRAQGMALFDEGRALMAKGKYAEACPKLQAAQKLILGIGTTVNLAECFEKLNRVSSAYVEYRRGASLSSEKGQAEREKYARERALALEPRVSKLTIRLPKEADVPGLEVRREGALVPAEALGSAVPIDVGVYKIEARAPGYQTQTLSVSITKEGELAEVAVPTLVRDAGAASKPAGPASVEPPRAARAVQPPTTANAAAAGPPIQQIAGYTIGGAGVALLVVSGITGGLALAGQADEGDCTSTEAGLECNEAGFEAQDSARDLAWASTGTMIAGAVLAVTGLVVVLTAPSNTPAADAKSASSARGLFESVSFGLKPGFVIAKVTFQ